MRTTDMMSFSVKELVAIGKAKSVGRDEWLHAVAEVYGNSERSAGENDFIVSLGDDVIPENLKPLVAKWRALAKTMDYCGPVCWRVRAGFTLKQHAPKAGPCYKKFQHLQDWDFTDEPTRDAIVFWIPRLVPGSTSKSVLEQMAFLTVLRKQLDLPKMHLASFGSAALLSGLILAHYKAMGERIPFDNYWVRTDTRRSGVRRLDLGFLGESGLDCDDWAWDETKSPRIGVFALGVEALGL